MTPRLGTLAFEGVRVRVRDLLEEVGGRVRRKVELSGLLGPDLTADGVAAWLDAAAGAASPRDYATALSLHPGRRLWVRRERYQREEAATGGGAAFTLGFECRDVAEESETETRVEVGLAGPGAEVVLATVGTAPALPVFGLTALTELVAPSLCDGERRLTYGGVVAAGQTLTLDVGRSAARLDGEDVTPWCAGHFPWLTAPSCVVTFDAEAAGAPAAGLVVTWRDRWL